MIKKELLSAIMKDQNKVAHNLIEKGIDVNSKTEEGFSLLMLASQKGNDEIVNVLIVVKML